MPLFDPLKGMFLTNLLSITSQELFSHHLWITIAVGPDKALLLLPVLYFSG